MAYNHTGRPCAIILTAIPIEYLAVRSHLVQLNEETNSQGTVYERGIFTSEQQEWDVGIVETGAGNEKAASEALMAIDHFHPKLMFFIGVAGGLKDVALGDVVVATKVYGYEYGKADSTFRPRPEVGNSSYRLQHRALAEARKQDWLQRLGSLVPETTPRVHVAPIAAGEKVVSSTRSATWEFLKTNYSDALAVEMEGHGFLLVAHTYHHVHAIVIRGISDLIDDKTEADAANTQELAARHASAFAFEVLAKLAPRPGQEKTYEDFTQSQRDFKDFKDKVEGKSGGEMAKERQHITFFPGIESKIEPTKLPETEEEFTAWYYGLGDYEQYYVLTTAVLHGAPVHEVAKRAGSLYQIIRDDVERNGKFLRYSSYQGDQRETQQEESLRFPDPLLRTIPGKDLRKITYTKTRKERGVERLYWQDADAYGLSTFGLRLLEFLCNEFISRGEFGQFFLNILQRWSEESSDDDSRDEVSRKAAHAYGVVLWCHDAIELKNIAKKWAKEDSPQLTAELLDGAYEIERVKSVRKVSNVGTSSVVLVLLKKWVKHIHKVLSTDKDEFSIEERENQADKKEPGESSEEEEENQDDEDEFDIEESKPDVAIRLGCAAASTYALIGKRSPDIALEGLERLLKLPLSNPTIDKDDIVDAGVSTYVILSLSGRVREVIEYLAASAEQLSHTRNLPRTLKKRQEYRRKREVYLNATLVAFFRIAAASLTEIQDSQNVKYSLSEPLPPQPAIPDPAGRDVLLAFLLSGSEVKCQEDIITLLCAAIIEKNSKHAFDLLRYWAEIVLRMHGTKDKDAELTYVTFLQFIVYLGRTVDEWYRDLQKQNLLPPPAVETFKNRLKQWCIEGDFYSHPIGTLAKEVLRQLST
jgi:nucleoside phosphorylase